MRSYRFGFTQQHQKLLNSEERQMGHVIRELYVAST
ncbi:MAG: Uncharacterised protein [Cyanobium sp. ARS6]|nr:MAG: Uncharacterised protein [Cyanobium sp. ARS6]